MFLVWKLNKRLVFKSNSKRLSDNFSDSSLAHSKLQMFLYMPKVPKMNTVESQYDIDQSRKHMDLMISKDSSLI